MEVKLEDRLFPIKARKHNVLLEKNQWGNPIYISFNEHLEINSLLKLLHKLNPTGHNEHLDELFNNLEPDKDVIMFRQELCKYVLSQETLLEKITRISPIVIQYIGDYRPEYPMKVFREYKHNLKLIIEGIESATATHPYFEKMKIKLQKEMDKVLDAEKGLESHYELRADFRGTITKKRKYPHNKTRKEMIYKVEIIDDYTIFVNESISGDAQSMRMKKTKYMKKHYEYGIRLCDVTFYCSEILEGVSTNAQKILQENHSTIKENKPADLHVIFAVDQKGFGKYETTGIYTMMNGDKIFNKTVKSSNSQGFPFHIGFFRREERNLDHIIQPIITDIHESQTIFENLEILASHANISKRLISYGAKFAEYSTDPSEQVIMKDMKCPLLILQKSKVPIKVIPNDVHITNDDNVVLLTGANFNGKSTYGIGVAQNLVLTQASFPGFFSYALIHPRSQFLTLFSDYGGNLETGESKHSKECIDLRRVLDNISPNAYIFIDEVGTGTDPEEGKDIGHMIFGSLTNLIDVAVIASTHYKDMVKDLAKNNHNVQPIAFNFDKYNTPTYKGVIGEVASTSAGSIIAEQKGLGPKDFYKFTQKWKKKGWTRD